MKPWTSESELNQKDTNLLFLKAPQGVLNIFVLIIIGVGSSLAVGTSVLIGELIKCVTGPAVVVSIILAGVTALFGGLCLAEFGVQFLKVDSAYPYAYCWGKSTGAFIFGWALIFLHVAGTASVAKGIITFTDALIDYKISDLLKNSTATSFPDVFPFFDYFSLAVVLLLTILILFGLKDSIIIKKLLTVSSIVLLISVIIAGATKADVKNWKKDDSGDESLEGKNGFLPFGGLGVIKGAAVAFYGFIGFDAFNFTGNEIKKRKKNLPLAILASISITLVIFSGIGVILTLMLPYTELNSYAAVPFAFQQVEWTAVKWVAIVATYLAFPTSFFGVVFPLPRIIQAMANDGLLFHWLGNNHQRFKTPVLAVMTGGVLAAAAAGFFTLRTLVNLAVIGALFVYTILAFNIVILRCFPKYEDNEKGFWKSLVCIDSNVSLKAVIKNYFNFKEKQPTNLTKAIVMGNLVLFCVCSIGLGIIVNVFYDCLVNCAAEAVVPASILLFIMFSNVMSMCCQPKSQEVVPFKVPMFPFIPCLSIFLNIFLMITFDSVTWILFSIWIILGILPYFLWRFWKFRKGELGKTSLYEINRTNAVKLNESIWKIKSDKKSFYEGAVNPVFTYDLDDNPDDGKDNGDAEVTKHNKETSLQSKQYEIIQKAESDVDKKSEYLNRELQVNFIPEDMDDNLENESEKVQWECVAEIHTEEEFSPESVALEIVDNTYNFLSEVSEETTTDDANVELVILKEQSIGDADQEPSKSESMELSDRNSEQPDPENNIDVLEALNVKNETEGGTNNNNNEQKEAKNEYKNNLENELPTVLQENLKEITNEKPLDIPFPKSASENSGLPFYDKNQHDEKLVHLIVETFYEAHQSEMMLQPNNNNNNNNNSTAAVDTGMKAAQPILDEQNKIKNFKEKLNQLLKNQINNAMIFTGNSSLSKSAETNNSETNNEINKDSSHESIKTLNKAQIKSKLELLLTKKPPQRPSLKSSFNINLKDTENENKTEKVSEDTQNGKLLNGVEKEDSSLKPSSTLVDSIREKILSLKNVDSEPNDICC